MIVRQNRDGEPKYFKLFGHFSLIALLYGATLSAQSFAEFKKQQAQSYKQYKDERDAAFQSYLKEQWKAYKKFVSASMYEKPKPKKIPQTKQKPAPKVGPKVVIAIKEPPKPKEPTIPFEVPAMRPPVEQKPFQKEHKEYIKPQVKEQKNQKPQQQKQEQETPQKVIQKDVVFNFFGSKIALDIPQGIKKAKYYPRNQKGIAAYFDAVASSEYEPLLHDIKVIKKSMNLNDWGLYLLVDAIAKKVYRYDDEQKLFKWFVFNKLGYAAKVGLSDGKVIAMFYSKKIIYATPNFKFGKKRYYVLDARNKKLGSVYSYRQDYPNATKALDLSLQSLPIFEPNYITKTVTFKHLGKEYSITYKYNKNLVDFFATYPQADYETFFNAAVDDITYASIAKSLKKYINGKKASEAMNFVLAFVQKAFAYETDQQQFGKEKPMFVEETLHYKASDCEDRAVLYSYLMTELFDVPTLGIKYPNHMATALYVPLNGDKIKLHNKEFVVADPTYINANIGQAMPQFRGKMPKEFILVTIK